MAFNGTEGAVITLAEGANMTANYRRTIVAGDTKGHFMGRDLIQKILDQPECMGIRVYYGIDENGYKSLVFVGADRNEDDMVGGVIADKSVPCPYSCGRNNPLNS
jgi:hypothetical protein